ncbi:MAG: hypothetical protein U5J83_16615 [Bryobacterales bacterium]|nr:hypothetical protein [Bryobacterales bacterium]
MSDQAWLKSTVRWLAAGLEVSALGGLLAIGLMVVLSGFSGMPWYSYGNLFATGVYPPTILDARTGYWTLTGFALAFLYFVSTGLVFALVFRSRRRGVGPHLAGVAYALALFMAGDRLWWQSFSPYIVIYGIHSHLMWGHVLFGATLGLISRRRARRDPALIQATVEPQADSFAGVN